MSIMSDIPLVYVVVLTYNHCQDTLQAIESLSRMTYPNYKLLIADNQSIDGTVGIVRKKYPNVEILVHPSNLGFAAGINPGLQHALDHGADFILAINNDVLVAPYMLTDLVRVMKPNIGASAPMIYYLDDPERIWSIGFSKHVLLLEMRGGARGQIDRGQWQTPFEVDYLLGCAILLSSSMLRDIGLFDERYFFYYEDLDLSLRARQRGYRLLTVPQAKMWHKGAGSSGVGSAFRTYQMARGSVIFFRSHACGLQRPASFLFRAGSALKASLRFLLSKQSHLLRHHWQGLWDGWQIS